MKKYNSKDVSQARDIFMVNLFTRKDLLYPKFKHKVVKIMRQDVKIMPIWGC